MNRRDFLKGVLGVVGLAVVPSVLAFSGETTQATQAVEPVKNTLMYNSVGKKLLFDVDELPQGALARYERDVSIKSYTVQERGIPNCLYEC